MIESDHCIISAYHFGDFKYYSTKVASSYCHHLCRCTSPSQINSISIYFVVKVHNFIKFRHIRQSKISTASVFFFSITYYYLINTLQVYCYTIAKLLHFCPLKRSLDLFFLRLTTNQAVNKQFDNNDISYCHCEQVSQLILSLILKLHFLF